MFLICFIHRVFSQLTIQPSLTKGGSNNVSYSKSTNSYIFSYIGTDGSLSYNYSLDSTHGGGSLTGLTVNVNNSYTFYPSYGGGIDIGINESTYFSWQPAVTITLIKTDFSNNVLITDWRMKIITGQSSFNYMFRYTMRISYRTLIIKAEKLGEGNDIASQFDLGRCENAPNPVIIGVPYLSMFNVLYSGIKNAPKNEQVFTSMFFDWTATNSSALNQSDKIFSNSSVYYSQNATYNKKTDGTFNSLNEIIYLTVSPDLEDVLPNIPNPVSKYRDESINRIIFDYGEGGSNYWWNKTPDQIRTLYNDGITNCWMIVHDWQKNGYDCSYPTDVMPANNSYGGDKGLLNIRNTAVNYGYLFSLHEDYWIIQDDSPDFNQSLLALPEKPWHWCWNQTVTQYAIKPTKYSFFYNKISPLIHSNYQTNAGYDDAFTNAPPSYYVDYDASAEGAGKFLYSLEKLRQIGPDLEDIIQGPVSAEGGSHFLFEGYFDDFEAEIRFAKQGTGQYGGYYKPLLVNFDLLKMRNKSFVHGVGYYQRFFEDCPQGQYCSDHIGWGPDSVLIYTATELAYAHGGFFSARWKDDLLYQANIQYKYVFPMQELYANALIKSILYNDNGIFLTVSDYIKKYPNDFDCFGTNCSNSNFMGQVRIEYNNGVLVYVNRHPSKAWKISFNRPGWYNYHAYLNNSNSVSINTETFNSGNTFTLPPESGWVCYSPSPPLNKNSK